MTYQRTATRNKTHSAHNPSIYYSHRKWEHSYPDIGDPHEWARVVVKEEAFSPEEVVRSISALWRSQAEFASRLMERTPSAGPAKGLANEAIERAATAFLNKFWPVAEKIIKDSGMKVIDRNIRDWRSADDPNTRQLVLELTISASSKDALKVWDTLSDHMCDGIKLEADRDSLLDAVALTVLWK